MWLDEATLPSLPRSFVTDADRTPAPIHRPAAIAATMDATTIVRCLVNMCATRNSVRVTSRRLLLEFRLRSRGARIVDRIRAKIWQLGVDFDGCGRAVGGLLRTHSIQWPRSEVSSSPKSRSARRNLTWARARCI